ncbi:MAG: TolC family protein, partial [Acidobacteriaceae bacterium]|nr:TolC family protein [Acidobacteriaceae bacterium]
MNSRYLLRLSGYALFAVLAAAPRMIVAQARHITLDEAIHLAISQNRVLKVARLKVAENQQKKAGEHSSYFPTLTNQSNALHITELQQVLIPAGSLGVAAGTPIPAETVNLQQGKQTIFTSGTMLAQPLTQLIRIHQQNLVAAAEIAISRNDVKKAENEIAVQVHTVYYGILIAQLQKRAAEQQTEYANENLRESEEDV